MMGTDLLGRQTVTLALGHVEIPGKALWLEGLSFFLWRRESFPSAVHPAYRPRSVGLKGRVVGVDVALGRREVRG